MAPKYGRRAVKLARACDIDHPPGTIWVRPDSRSPCHRVGDRVIALELITECGDGHVNPRAAPCHPGWVHATVGDAGTVIHVTEDGDPTVRFERIGTATLVSDHEVHRVGAFSAYPEA